MGFELISVAYLLVSGDRKLFFPAHIKQQHTEMMRACKRVKVEEKKKDNIDHVKSKWKQLNEHAKTKRSRSSLFGFHSPGHC